MPDLVRQRGAIGYPEGWPALLVGDYLLQHAQARANQVAVVAGDSTSTFSELSALSNIYLDALDASGIGHGDRVMAVMEPGVELVALFAAVTKLGAIHVPCNASTPTARLEDIAEQTAAVAIVTDGRSRTLDVDESVGGLPVFLASVRGLTYTCAVRTTRRAQRTTIDSDTAYVIFTSGSTGRPKGVVMSHRAAVAAFRGIADACRVDGRLGSCAPAGFDLTILDMAAALGRGHAIDFVPRTVQLHPVRLTEYLAGHRITQVHSVPSLWQILVRFARDRLGSLVDLRRIVLGGESLSPGLVAAIRAELPGLGILNLYGQTETICCSFHDVPLHLPAGADSIPVGDPYPGVDMILIDENGCEVTQVGDRGELYLRAASLFSGYWRAPELTSQRIVSNPVDTVADDRWLKTGDVLRIAPDGLHFVGRVDRQVQLFGNRVELGEIEACLEKHEAVQASAVVAVRSDAWDTRKLIVAFIELRPGAEDPESIVGALRTLCCQELPPYMVPSRLLTIKSWPLADTGKVDLGELERNAGGTTALA